MFGYITPDINELKVKEYAVFQSYYCGLCRTLKEKYKTTAILNYDSVFIYILGDSLNGNKETLAKHAKCGLHPIKGKNALITDSAGYAAAINILMAYYKLQDDATDENNLRSKAAKFLLKKKLKKAAGLYPEISGAAGNMWIEQRNAELNKTVSTDLAADPYAKLFGYVLQRINKLYECQLYDLGYSIGRWVYLIDAYDDIKKDLNSGAYNVFIQKYSLEKTSGDIPDNIKKNIETSLYFTLSRAYDAYLALDLKQNEYLLSNIIKLGLKNRTKNILESNNEGKEDGSIPRFRRK